MDRLRSWFKSPLLPAIVLVGYAALVFDNFVTRPYIWLDEGFKMQLGRNLLEHGIVGVQFVPGAVEYFVHNVSTGWVLPAALAGAFGVLDVSFFTGRLVAAFFLLGFVVCAYLLARRYFGPTLALFSLLLLVTYAPLYAQGKMLFAEMPALFFVTLGFLLFDLSRTTRTWLSGLCVGLGAAAKPSFAAALLPALALSHGYLALRDSLWRPLLVWWVPVVFAALPTVFLALAPAFFPGEYASLSTGNYADVHNTQCLSCVVVDNLKLFVTHTTLLHLVAVALPSLIAAVLLLRRAWDWRIAAALLFVGASVAYFFTTPGVFRHLLPTVALALMVLPAALYFLLQHTTPRHARALAYTLLSLLIVVQTAHFATGAAIFRSDNPARFEAYVREHIPNDASVGIINSALAPVVMPSERMVQFFRLNDALIEGVHPLGGQVPLPQYLVYTDFFPEKDVEPYRATIDSKYRHLESFGDIELYQLR